MNASERRLRRLLDEATEMKKALTEGGSGATFDPAAFLALRTAALTAIHDHFGILHPYTRRFDRSVTGSDRDSVVLAVGLLANALSDVQGGLVPPQKEVLFDSLLHPVIRRNALDRFVNGHYRDAVFNSVVAVFDLIRDRTGLQLDGDALVTRALSLDNPHLILGDRATESGRNEQRGIMQILQGAYAAIRNPKAHSLSEEPSREDAAQYMVFASLLARWISEAQVASSRESR